MLTAAPDYHGALNLLGAILIPLENTFMTVRLFDFKIARPRPQPINAKEPHERSARAVSQFVSNREV
jgi:hypothetical protein